MTTEQKAKAYDRALSVALETYKTQPMYRDWLEKMFPELKESDDESIRKALINGFNKLGKSAVWYNGITNGQILAWLEKQCQVRCTGVGKKEETGVLKKMLDDEEMKELLIGTLMSTQTVIWMPLKKFFLSSAPLK